MKSSANQFTIYFENLIKEWPKFYRLNKYYHHSVQKLVQFLIPRDASVVEFGSRFGEMISLLPNKNKIGLEASSKMVSIARKNFPSIKFVYDQYDNFHLREKFDYVLLPNTIQYLDDIQLFIKKLKSITHDQSRIVVIYFNFAWKPFLQFAERLGLRLPQPREPNWLTSENIDNLFYLEHYTLVKKGKKFLFPYYLPLLSNFINRYLAPLPLINNLCLISYAVYKKDYQPKNSSVSVIIPMKNEEGNIPFILDKIPRLGENTEIVFINDHSTDHTQAAVQKEIKRYRGLLKAVYYVNHQTSGKAHAVRLGFNKAKNNILMILDADLTVAPSELTKFYDAIINGTGELVIGSRLMYPMEKEAMRFFNYLGNKFFGTALSFLLDQKINDSLCGTKVLCRDKYQKIEKNRDYFGDFDIWGDFDLIFGASKLNIKIIEIPIRYKERKFGQSNMRRFLHGVILLRMVLFAARKIKFS